MDEKETKRAARPRRTAVSSEVQAAGAARGETPPAESAAAPKGGAKPTARRSAGTAARTAKTGSAPAKRGTAAKKRPAKADVPFEAAAAEKSAAQTKTRPAPARKAEISKGSPSSARKKPAAEIAKEVAPKPQNVEEFVKERLGQQDEAPAQTAEADMRAIRKRFRSKKTVIPDGQDVRRYSPDVNEGLSAEQVNERFSQFLFNDTNQKYSKSYASIFIGNLCTFFNLLCVLAAVALIYSGASFSQFLFVVIFALNIAFGIVMEIRAKRKIDKLSLLTVPTARVIRGGRQAEVHAKDIVLDDIVVLTLGNQIPADCILAEGSVEVNEALLTGESVPVKKEAGDLLYAGSFISGGTCKARADKVGKNTYLNSLSAKAKKYKKPNSELMRSTKWIISVIGILIIPIATGMFFVNRSNILAEVGVFGRPELNEVIQRTVSVVIGMIPSGMLLLTSVALTVGILRLMTHNTLVQDLYSLEMLARVNVLCLDKTGTITDGCMKVNDCMLLNNPTDYTVNELIGSYLAALQDNNQTSIALYNYFGHSSALEAVATIPFTSKRKFSAATLDGVGTIAVGAPEFVLGSMPEKIGRIVNQYASMGLRVLLVAHSAGKIAGDKLPAGMKPLAIISIADNIREDAAQTIRWFKENDVAIKIISGDNPVTVSEVARRVGVNNAEKYISLEGLNETEVAAAANKYTVFGRVTPEQKAILVKSIKSEGNTVAMTGDGVNDILAMKEADCAVSVASGSEAAKNVSHIVLLDNNFSSMPKVVFEGRRVINNIQNSSSMYLMKTLFTTIFAVISLILWQGYPFKTNNMMLMEFFVIGIPTFFLSLQPNTNRVSGRFLPSVLAKAVPCAVVLVMAVESVSIITAARPDFFQSCYDTVTVVVITFAGLVMLYRVCQPLNFFRGVLMLAMVACCVLGLTLLPGMFLGEGFAALNFVSVLYLIIVILLCFPLSAAFLKISEKLRSQKKNTDAERYLR